MATDVSTRPLTGANAPDPGTMTGTATFNTRGLPVAGRRLSIAASWSGTPTGTFTLQCLFADGTWRTVPGAAAEFTANGQAHPAGSASSAVWNWSNIPGAQWRLSYTNASGSGTLTSAFAWSGN